MPTFLARFSRSLPSDFVEWCLAISVLALGILWLIFPNSFNRADMAEFLEIMSPRLWTTTAIMVGLVSCVAIIATTEIPRFAGAIRVAINLVRITLFGAFIGRSWAASEFDGLSASLGLILWSLPFVLDIRNIMRNVPNTLNSFRKVYRVHPSLVR